MKTKTIEARQVGWIVEFRIPESRKNKWDTLLEQSESQDKRSAINVFNARCRFHWIPGRVIEKYKWLKARGLARCVAVYVEVSDEKA